jgi:hypothetical protein
MAWARREMAGARGGARALAVAGMFAATALPTASGCGGDELAGAGGGGGHDGAGGRGGGGSDAEAATATVAAGYDVGLGRVVIEQGHKVQGDDSVFYLSAHAWFTEGDAETEETPCEGVEEGGCVLVGPCPSLGPPSTVVDVGAASLASGLLQLGMPRLGDGTYGVTFDQRLAATADGIDATFGSGRDRFHVTATVPPGIEVVTPVLGDPIARDEDLEVAVETVGTAAEIRFAIGDAAGRIECRWPGADRGGVLPATLLEQLDADSVLVVAWTEQARRGLAGRWDVAWVAREVAYASPVELR